MSQTQFTVTVKLPEDEFPQLSVAVNTTVVTPDWNVLPLECVDVIVAAPQLSVAVGAVHVATAEHADAGALKTMLDGILFNVGFVSSTRVIVCWQLAVRLLSFGLVATHVLTFVVSPQLCAGTVMLSLYVIVAAAQPAVEVEVAEPVTVGLVLVPGHAV